jgi:hypothetical protein
MPRTFRNVPGEELWKFAVATRGARFLFDQGGPRLLRQAAQ